MEKMKKNKRKIVIITSIVLTAIVSVSLILGALYYSDVFNWMPDKYADVSYKNEVTQYFENEKNFQLDSTTIIPNSQEKFSQNYKYTDVLNGTNYDTTISLAINSFFKIVVETTNDEIYESLTGFTISNGFRLKVYFSPTDNYKHENNFYGQIKQFIVNEGSDIFFEYKKEGEGDYSKLFNLKNSYVYDSKNPSNAIIFENLLFINSIIEKDRYYLLIDNEESLDRLFNDIGDYRIRVSHQSVWRSSGSVTHSEYFESQTIFTTIKKTKNKLNNLLMPDNHTLQELFYTLKFDNLDNNYSYIVCDQNIPRLSGNGKLFLETNCFTTNFYENKKHSTFLVDPNAVKLEIFYQQDYDVEVKLIYSLTNFINEHETLKLMNKQTQLNYYQPNPEVYDLTDRFSFSAKGIYCVKLTYKVQSIICKNMQPMGNIVECEDTYFFEFV